MTRMEASHLISAHLLLVTEQRHVDAIRQAWEIAFRTGGIAVTMSLETIRREIALHLRVCDAIASRGNHYGHGLWRDQAAAVRWVLAQAEAST